LARDARRVDLKRANMPKRNAAKAKLDQAAER